MEVTEPEYDLLYNSLVLCTTKDKFFYWRLFSQMAKVSLSSYLNIFLITYILQIRYIRDRIICRYKTHHTHNHNMRKRMDTDKILFQETTLESLHYQRFSATKNIFTD